MNDKRRNKKQLSTAETIIRKFFDGEITGEFIELVQGWLASGDSREEIEAALGEIFEKKVFFEGKPRQELIDALPELRRKAGYTAGERTAQERETKKVPLRKIPVFRTVAAAALLAVGITSLWVYRTRDHASNPAIQHIVSVTAPDHEREITLPDGSTVRLDKGSELDYAENFGENRTCELDGEGYFKVVETGGKPFTVNSKGLTVTVLGTEFRIHAVDGENTAHVTLTEGVVEVTAGEHTRTLTPGQMLTYDKTHRTVSLNELGRGELLRLRGESMTFDDETLDEIFRTVAGWYGVRIDVRPQVDTRREVIVGFDGRETLDEVMFILQNITGNSFGYGIEGDTVTVTATR